MFFECKKFKGNGLDNWDVSNVINMEYMFMRCENLDCDLSQWDVSNVKDMNHMFFECKNLIFDLSKWNIDSLNKCNDMFKYCKRKFIPNWYRNIK